MKRLFVCIPKDGHCGDCCNQYPHEHDNRCARQCGPNPDHKCIRYRNPHEIEVLKEIARQREIRSSSAPRTMIIFARSNIMFLMRLLKEGRREQRCDPFYQEGYEAFFEGPADYICPYPEGSDGEYGYRKGWRAAEKEYELKQGDNCEDRG